MDDSKNFLTGIIPYIVNIDHKKPEIREQKITDNGSYCTTETDQVDVDVPAPAEDITPEEQTAIVTEEKF